MRPSSRAPEIVPVGKAPPLGVVPKRMYAQVIRENRFGEPKNAFRIEEVETPQELAPDEVLVYVMAAGVNFNNVWAALGTPMNVIRSREKQPNYQPFHVGGSDGAGIVWKTGKSVTNVKVGDKVVLHCGTWNDECPVVQSGNDPMMSPTFKIWGYETNWGSFAQFTKVQAHQCLTKPNRLTWEASAAYMLVGATAYRMLAGWPPHTVKPGDVVLVWGGAGGLGCQAIQIVREMGGIPIAVIGGEEKREFCMNLGAKGCINRNDSGFRDLWGMMPNPNDIEHYADWLKEVRNFGGAIWKILGEKKNPRIVFEHPGQDTLATSLFVCDPGGMVVICAGTTGYSINGDLRYLWMRQKRLQGSHFANDNNAWCLNNLVAKGRVDPCLSRTFSFQDIPIAHQLMRENTHPSGNMACLIGAPHEGLR